MTVVGMLSSDCHCVLVCSRLKLGLAILLRLPVCLYVQGHFTMEYLIVAVAAAASSS